MSKNISKKVCLLGDFAVGKTSLVRRYVYDLFDERYISTIGVKVSRKTTTLALGGEIVELTMMLWDLAGSEEFDRVRSSYFRGSSGAVLVCDLTRPETLSKLKQYTEELQKISPEARLIIAANKHDLVEESPSGGRPFLDPAQVEELANSLRAPYFFTSAKRGDEVEALFRCLAQALVGGGA